MRFLKEREVSAFWRYLNVPPSISMSFESLLCAVHKSLGREEDGKVTYPVSKDILRRALISSMIRVGVKLLNTKEFSTHFSEEPLLLVAEGLEFNLEKIISKSWADSLGISEKLSDVLTKRSETSDRLNHLFSAAELLFYHMQSVVSKKYPGSLPDDFSELLGSRDVRPEVAAGALSRMYEGWDRLYGMLKTQNFWYPPWEELRGTSQKLEDVREWFEEVASYVGAQSPQFTEEVRNVYESVWTRLDPELLKRIGPSVKWPVGATLSE